MSTKEEFRIIKIGFKSWKTILVILRFRRLQTVDSIFEVFQIVGQRSKLQQILREVFDARVKFVDLRVDAFFVRRFNVEHSTFERVQHLADLKINFCFFHFHSSETQLQIQLKLIFTDFVFASAFFYSSLLFFSC